MLLESFGSTVKLLTALFVEFSVVYFSCSSICSLEISCNEEKCNKAPSSIHWLLSNCPALLNPQVCLLIDSKLLRPRPKFIIKSTKVFIDHLKENNREGRCLIQYPLAGPGLSSFVSPTPVNQILNGTDPSFFIW